MQESKTIEIDEIVTPGKTSGDGPGDRADGPHSARNASRPDHGPTDDPFAGFQKALPWKARLTLWLTQWFMLLRSKSWGKLILIPTTILALLLFILLAIPVGIIATFLLLTRRLLK